MRGGHPNDARLNGEAPTFGIEGGFARFTHPRPSDTTGMVYHVESCTDLSKGIWKTNRHSHSETDVTGGRMDYESYFFPFREGPNLFRMRIVTDP